LELVGHIGCIKITILGHIEDYFLTNTGFVDTGGVFALLICGAGSIIFFFGWKTYKLVRDNAIHLSTIGN
jgi:hypothetical protein